MTRTYGEYEVTLDSKGRIMLPAGYKKQLPEEESNGFMLTKGNGNFLVLYTASQWKKVEEKLDSLNDYNEEALELKFSMMNGASGSWVLVGFFLGGQYGFFSYYF